MAEKKEPFFIRVIEQSAGRFAWTMRTGGNDPFLRSRTCFENANLAIGDAQTLLQNIGETSAVIERTVWLH